MLGTLRQKALAGLSRRFDSELFAYRQLRDMFIPLLLDQLFIFGIGILSSAMVSSSGQGAISAVTDATMIGSLAYAMYSAIAMGAGIVVARTKGAGNEDGMRKAIGESCVVCTLIGALMAVAVSGFGKQLIRLLYPAVEESIAVMAGDYLRVFGLSILPYSLFNMIFTAFRSTGETRSSLVLTLVINSVYLLCSLVYINGLDMGPTGAALAYLTARLIGFAFALYWLMRKKCALHMRWRDYLHVDRRVFKDIFALGIPLSVEQILFQGGMLLVQMYIARLPTLQTDANGIANSMFMLYYVFCYSLTGITATVCGQCVGARNPELIRRYCRNFVAIGRIVLAIAVLILLPLSPVIVKLFSADAELAGPVYKAVAVGALPLPFIWCDAYLYSEVTRAAGDSVFTTTVSLVALLIGRMLTGYLLTIVLNMGIVGIWLGQLAEWVFRAVVLRLRFRGRRWIKFQKAAEA